MTSIKRFITSILSSFFVVISTISWAHYTKPLLVQDMAKKSELPRNFRSTANLVGASSAGVNLTGLEDLRIAGGGQFSVPALQEILKQLQITKLTVIDLREESHGFVDGTAISWYAPHDAINAGKTMMQIEQDQSALLEKLAHEKHINIYKIQKKTKAEAIAKAASAKYPVHSVSSEEEFVESMNMRYERIYVQDFHAPAPEQVDRFLAVVKAIPKGEWIYLHCRAGVGRTSTFMAMYDMLHHAKELTFEEVLARQAAIGGKDFNTLPEQGKWKYPYAVERLDFLKKFYEYARSNQDDFKTSWSEWLGTKKSN